MLLNEAFNFLNLEPTNDINTIKSTYRKISIKKYHDPTFHNQLNNAYSTILNQINSNNINTTNKHNNHLNNPTNLNNPNYLNTNIISNNLASNNFGVLENIIKNVEITYEQAFTGTTIPINISRKIITQNREKIENETLYIDIPEGIDNDEIILLNNKGNIHNDKCSDIKIIIMLKPHDLYQRDGLNIIRTFNISFKESLTSFKTNFEHLNKKKYKIQSKKGEIITPFIEKKLANLGFKRNNYCGDLIIKFIINYPKFIKEEQVNQLLNIL